MEKNTGYGIRNLVETAFFRYKQIFRDRMRATNFDCQIAESKLACKAVNMMTALGSRLLLQGDHISEELET